MKRVVPFTDQAFSEESAVMRLMVYMSALMEESAEIAADIDVYNSAFEKVEEILQHLPDNDPDMAVELMIYDGNIIFHPSKALLDAVDIVYD